MQTGCVCCFVQATWTVEADNEDRLSRVLEVRWICKGSLNVEVGWIWSLNVEGWKKRVEVEVGWIVQGSWTWYVEGW